MKYIGYLAGLLLIHSGVVRAGNNSSGLSVECEPPLAWEDVSNAAAGKILWVGELHGTAEGPQVFAEYVCAVALLGGRTLVGVEYPSDETDFLNAGLDAESPLDYWLSGNSWRAPEFIVDGRHSEAMVDLLLSVKALRDSGIDIELVGFDVAFDPKKRTEGNSRDEIMARNVREAVQGFDRAVILTGNLHARRVQGSLSFQPAASFMEDHEGLSIIQTYDGGSAWNCQQDGCRVYDTVSNFRSDNLSGAIPAMAISDDLQPTFDGYMHVGAATASKPFDIAD